MKDASLSTAFFWQLRYIAGMIEWLQAIPQYHRLCNIYGMNPTKILEASEIRKVLTKEELERKPKVPIAVWMWLLTTVFGYLARIPGVVVKVVRVFEREDGGDVWKMQRPMVVMELIFPVEVLIVFVGMVVASVVFARRQARKAAL